MSTNYSHVVSIEEHGGGRVVKIYRLVDGDMHLYTETNLQCSVDGVDWDEFERLASWLGKSICIDSPMIRKCTGIEAEADAYERNSSQ